MKPRVLIIGPTPPPVGGMAQVAQDCLDACVKMNCYEAVSIQARHGIARRPGRLDLTNLLLHFKLLGLVKRECKVPGTALAHLHASVGTTLTIAKNLEVARVVKAVRLPLVLQPHSGRMEERFAAARRGSGKDLRWRGQLLSLIRLADAVVVMSSAWHDILANECPGVRLMLVENGVDTDCYQPGDSSARQWTNLMFMGQLAEHKGLAELTEAWKLLHASCGGTTRHALQLHVLGEARDPLGLALATELGTLPGVQMHGVLTGPAKLEMLQSCGVFLLPSHYENMPVALLEAMACGMACVATRVGAVPEILGDGAGQVVDARDSAGLAMAAAELIDNPSRCIEMGARARERVEQSYGFKAFASKLHKLYDQLAVAQIGNG